MAKQIDLLRIEAKVDRLHVVGHDAGSVIAVQYAHSYRDRVCRLALLSPALFPDLKPFYLLEILRKPILGELLAPLVNPIFWKIAMPSATRNQENLVDAILSDFHEPFLGLKGSWQFMRALRWGSPYEVLAHVPGMLPQLTAPTLIFHGSRDPAIPQSFALRTQRLIPKSQLVHVDCGHFIPLNRPEFVAGTLDRFFDNLHGCQDCRDGH
jgi:pimeloyl-ACP methyl ester carboxylesterase